MSETETQFRQDHLPAATVLSLREQRGLTVRAAPAPATRISARRAALGRTIGQGLRVLLPGLEATLTIHLTTDDQRTGWPDALTLSGPDGGLEIEEGARLLRVLTGIDIDAANGDDDGHTDWLLSAVLGRLASTPFSSFDRIAKKAPSISKETEVLRLVLRSGRHLVSTHLRADAATFTSLLARTKWSQIRQPVSAYASLPMQISVRIGSHVLSASRLHSLAAGDILLPESTSFNAAGEGWLTFGKLGIHARYSAPGRLTVLDVRPAHGEGKAGSDEGNISSRHKISNLNKGKKMEEHYDEDEQYDEDGQYDEDEQYDEDMQDEEEMHAEDSEPAAEKADEDAQAEAGKQSADDADALDSVDIPLHFELGKVTMSLGDMRTLAAGSIVQFSGGSPESVAIVSSGRTLGRGEVVDVDGRLGIRITQWRHESE
jgi:type III secretion protein Q